MTRSKADGTPERLRNPKHLPTKICAACGREFTWRKKWERDWEQVRFCSDRCRVGRNPPIIPSTSKKDNPNI